MKGNGTSRHLVWSVYQIKYFSYFSTKTYVAGTQKNRLNETVLSSTQLTGKKIFTILRSKKFVYLSMWGIVIRACLNHSPRHREGNATRFN